MKILAVDTSSNVATVAITDHGKILGEYTINHKNSHSSKLIPMIMELMSKLEVVPGDIDLYSVSSGPGSFTGLRIGVTTIKAMAYAGRKPVIGVPTLDGLAYNIPVCESLICPIIDARNNQVYTALYKWENGLQVRTTEYMGIHIGELVDLVKGNNCKAIFLGDGVLFHREFLENELQEMCGFSPENLLLQRASSVARVAAIRLSDGMIENYFDLIPFYLRKSQAEREYDKKQRTVDN